MRNRSGGEMSSASATVRVEKATSDLLIGPDWTMNMDICDSINNDHWQAKDVVKALKKRLQHKNPKVQFLALTLLETMIKNCGDNVHFQVVDRDILQEMVKIVRKKTDMQVRDKILVLLDSWQEAFGGPGGKYPQYYLAYTDLKRSGVEFPKRSPDSALIFTPPVQHPGQLPRHLQLGYGMPSNSSLRLEEAMASEMANLSLSDLDRYRSVMELLGDMLKAVNPGDREAIKDELIVDLVSQCRSNQKKLMEMVNSTGDEELLGQCLALNDDLQSLLAKHDSIASGASLPAEASESTPEPNTPVALAPMVANRSEDEEEDDDDFAQLARRNSKYQANQAAAEANQQVSSPNHSDETNATSGSTSEASSSVASNALALPDPPAPVKTSTKEQDMIDLLSITLSSNLSPPRTPLTPPSVSLQSQSLSPVSSNGPGSPYNSQQPYMTNQGYVPYNSYVAPWAQQQSQPHPQPQPQQQAPQFLSSYPSQTQPQPQHQFPSSYPSQPQPQPQPPHQPQPQQQVPQYRSSYPSQPQPQPQPQQQMLQGQSSYLSHAHPQYRRSQQQAPSNYPPPPWESTSSANPNPFSTSTYPYTTPAASTSTYMPRPQPQYASNVPVASTTEAQVNPNLTRQTGYGASPKPYIPANKLFEDLIDLKAADRGGKTSSTSQTLSGSPHQGMIGGRK